MSAMHLGTVVYDKNYPIGKLLLVWEDCKYLLESHSFEFPECADFLTRHVPHENFGICDYGAIRDNSLFGTWGF